MASNIFEGMYRLVHVDANDNIVAELLEKHSSEFGIADAATGTEATYETDAQKMPKVKKHLSTVLRQDDKLVLRGMPDVDTTVDVSDDGWSLRIPVTFKNVRTGVVYEKTLTFASFTEKISADVTLEDGVWYDLLEYAIPAQSMVKLGHAIQDVRVDSAIYIGFDSDITD